MAQDTISDQLRFLEVDDDTRAALRDFMPVAEAALPSALDSFYRHIESWPRMTRMFGKDAGAARSATDRARNAQIEHWKRLFSGRFDDSYLDSARRIALTHSRIGLEPASYIGGYTFTLNRLYKAIAMIPVSRMNPAAGQEKIARMLRAVNQAVMLDMNIVITIYLEENKRVYEAKLSQLAETFESSIKGVVDAVMSSSVDMEKTAKTMKHVSDEAGQRANAVSLANDE